jgi:elongation factor 1-gamma
MGENNIKKIINKSPTRTLPLLKNGDFYLSDTLAIISYIGMKDEQFSEKLTGKAENKPEVCMWLHYIVQNIWPFYDHIIGQITGSSPKNEEVFNIACNDLMGVLGNINETLRFKSFLIGSSLTLADFILAVSLYPYFSMVFDEECRIQISNVTRLYLYASNVKQFQQVLGISRLCRTAQKPSDVPFVQRSSLLREVQIKPKDMAKPREPKPKEQAKPKELKPTEDTGDDLEELKEKKKNPLELLPPSLFELDQFKKDFLNTKEKQQILNDFWKKFDPEGFSVWFVHYHKSPEQGKLAFKTKNLRSNFLQKIDKFRKYTFAVHGVYGQEPDLEIEGVWLWRGKEIPEEVSSYIKFVDFNP